MSPRQVDSLLSGFEPSRREFLKRVALTTAWAAPIVASFSIDGLGLTGAYAGAGNLLCSNLTLGSNLPVTELRIQKEVSPAQVDAGGEVTFTITVVNCASVDATNVTVTDELPAGLGFVSVQQTGGQAADSIVAPPVGSTGAIVIGWATLNGDEEPTFEIVARAL